MDSRKLIQPTKCRKKKNKKLHLWKLFPNGEKYKCKLGCDEISGKVWLFLRQKTCVFFLQNKLKNNLQKNLKTDVFLIYELCQHIFSIFLHSLLIFHKCATFFLFFALNKSYKSNFLLFFNVGENLSLWFKRSKEYGI